LAQRSVPRADLPPTSSSLTKQIQEARKNVDKYYGANPERKLVRTSQLTGRDAVPEYPRAGTQREAFSDYAPSGKMNYNVMRNTGTYDPGYSSMGFKIPANIQLQGPELSTQLNAVNSNPTLRSQTVSDMADNIVEAFNKAFSDAKSVDRSLSTDDFVRRAAEFYEDLGSSGYISTGINEPGLINAMSGGFSAGASPADELGALVQTLIRPRYFPQSARGAQPYNAAMRAVVSEDPLSFWHTAASGNRLKVPSYIRTREAKAQETLNKIRIESDNAVADRHATDLAFGMKGTYDSANLRDIRRYGIVEDAFAKAGKKLGVDPSKVQDITWHWWRDLTLEQPTANLPPVGRMIGDLLGQAGGRARIDPLFRAPLETRREMLAAYRGLGPEETQAAISSAERYDALIRLAQQGGLA
jgi:hypothetical protein